MAKINLLIAGAQKSGTSTLKNQLDKHLEIHMPNGEGHYFELESSKHYYVNRKRGPKWYEDVFGREGMICGEKTPDYLYYKESPKMIYEYNPDMKLIFILRHPVDRAYSQYRMRIRNSNPDITFEEIVDDKDNEYIKRGIYWKQLKRFKELFPQKNIRVYILKDLKDNPKAVYKDIYNFLDVREIYPEDLHHKYHRGGVPNFDIISDFTDRLDEWASNKDRVWKRDFLRKLSVKINMFNVRGQVRELISPGYKSYPSMSNYIRQDLLEFYKPHNHKLKVIYPDLDISHWDE